MFEELIDEFQALVDRAVQTLPTPLFARSISLNPAASGLAVAAAKRTEGKMAHEEPKSAAEEVAGAPQEASLPEAFEDSEAELLADAMSVGAAERRILARNRRTQQFDNVSLYGMDGSDSDSDLDTEAKRNAPLSARPDAVDLSSLRWTCQPETL